MARIVFFSLLLSVTCVFGKVPELTPKLAVSKTKEILRAHVKHKKFDAEVAKRTLANYIEELDPTKSYFIETEVDRYLNPSDDTLQAVVYDFKHKRFTAFEEIHSLFQEAVKRRGPIEVEIASRPLEENLPSSDFKELKWSHSVQDLKDHIFRLRSYQYGTARKIDQATGKLFLQRLDKRRLNHEQALLEEPKKQVLTLFLKGVASSLDAHTAYFTPAEANQFMIQVQQRLFGIGAQLRDDLNGLTLVTLIDGGPASHHGEIRAGDKIIAVNGEPIIGMDINEAVELIRGPKGTAVRLSLLRESEETMGQFEVEIIRDEIVFTESRYETDVIPFGNGVIAHLRLYTFYQDQQSSSAKDLRNALEKMRRENSLQGVILDLRNNAGGVLSQAVEVTGLFIKNGVVVSVKDHTGFVQHLRNVSNEISWTGPLVVLTNAASASASEIVAQTLQDYGRALVIGDESTYGKGSYQTFTLENADIARINPEGEYKVTRGLYFTVSGKSPQLTGCLADIVVPGNLSQFELGEHFAKYPLENETIPPSFNDKLEDIHPFQRGKVLRTYAKNLQAREELYAPYLPTLISNSKKRIAENGNYQNFLKELKKEEFDPDTAENFGKTDLQLDETISITKDLILLTRKNRSN